MFSVKKQIVQQDLKPPASVAGAYGSQCGKEISLAHLPCLQMTTTRVIIFPPQ